LKRFRLRTKFLLSLLIITAGLSTATLLIVRYSVEKQVRNSLEQDLHNSVNTYQSFERQRQEALTRSAELLANLPNVRAMMTTRDEATIQDASRDIWRQSGSDLLVLAGLSGNVWGMQTSTPGFDREIAQEFLRRSLSQQNVKDWWFGGGHLYEVWIQPVYLGQASENTALGFLVVGHEIDARAARDFSNIAASEVAFYSGDALVASTLSPSQQQVLAEKLHGSQPVPRGVPEEWELGTERYLSTTVNLSPGGDLAVSLTILKSVDKATLFVRQLNHVLVGLGLFSVIAGSFLVFLTSHTFTRPLANLVTGVRALEQGDFSYPLDTEGRDEVGEVTGAFSRMRANLQKTQAEQKQLEERLRQAHKMEAVGRLAGGVAHDFNNLLTIICGHGDLLQDRVGSTEALRHSVEQIQKAAKRAVSMTRQLLAFSRMQVLQPRVLDLNNVVADLGKMLPRLIGEHVEYSFAPDPKLAAIKADPGQVEQVLLNLVVNSRDAMPNGGAITVRPRMVDMDAAEAAKRSPMTAGHYALLSVTDTGHGMDEETKTHIFEPFFTTKGIGKGTGLGLATVYGVVKQSGGFIWVESAVEKGTTFEIYFPAVQEKVAPSDDETKPRAAQRGSETIMVVEDEPGVRELTCEFLKVSGYSVVEAKDGIDALEIAAKHTQPIHLVLSDMVMPKMGGRELAGRLKIVLPDAKILFMSGYSEYSNAGASNQDTSQLTILQKPFSISALVDKVREVLQRDGVVKGSDEKVSVT
jgi:signal transduction histidine kinase/CheY-like chemotaxis protein